MVSHDKSKHQAQALLIYSKMSNNIQNSNEVRDGKFISYHNNGNIKEEGTYIDGMLQGVFREYDQDGKLIVQPHWKDHKLQGKLTHWRNIDLGILYETVMYSHDLKVYSSTFDEDSRISGNYYYTDGIIVKSVEYIRRSGYIYVATTINGYYSEEMFLA